MYLGLKEGGITLSDAARFMNGELLFANGEEKAFGVCTDSRKVAKNDIFFALCGEKFDGHVFARSSVESGAVCAVVSKKTDEDFPQILVSDTKKALGDLAANYYARFPSLTVGITGSVGKTTTKEFIAAVLSQKYNTAKTAGNFNNEIGLPLTLLSFAPPQNALALEMGMSNRGEISRLTHIARPDIGIITNIGSSHLENLGTRENIALAKLEITEGMKDGAYLILNGDEPLLKNLKDIKTKNIYASTLDKNCDIFAYNIREERESIVFDCTARFKEREMKDIVIPTIGKHNVYNALYAIAVGLISEMDEESIRRGLLCFTQCAMRGNITKKNGITIIEDCYNASPESMRASIDTLSHVANGARRIAFLGDMRELGNDSAKMHFSVGEYAAKSGVDMIFTFGKSALDIAEGAISAGFSHENIFSIENTDDEENAAEALKNVFKPGDVVLFKASRALKLERISKKI